MESPLIPQAAMTIVFDQLGGHIPTSGGASLLEGAYFQYWMRSPEGGVIWAKLPPEFWKELVKDCQSANRGNSDLAM